MVFTPVDKSALQAALNKWYELANDGSVNAVTTANSVTKAQYDADPSTVKYYGNPKDWDVSGITDMSILFRYIVNTNHPDISSWDVSNVKNMTQMFQDSNFNNNIGNWNTSSVTNMSYMFNNIYFNQDINTKEVTVNGTTYTAWDVSSVTNMNAMFFAADSFNSDISNWDVSNVIDMNYMFYGASAFNQDISNWDVSKVEDMSNMFEYAAAFNQNISYWNVRQYKSDGTTLTDLNDMFLISGIGSNNTYGFSVPTPLYTQFNQILTFKPADKSALQAAVNKWYELANNSSDPDAVTTANSVTKAQYDAGTYPYYGNPNTWDVSGITDMSKLFSLKTQNNHPDISDWDVSSVTNMYGMFDRSSFNQDISGWDVSSVINIGYIFYGASAFNQDIGQWNVSQVTNMRGMFFGAAAFNQPIRNWNVSQVTDMLRMFGSATVFNQDIGQWDVSQVTNMFGMFAYTAAFNQDIGQWDVSQVTNMTGMFDNAAVFNQNINTKEVTAENSPTGVAYTAWDVSQVTTMWKMFQNANKFNQPIGNWDVSSVTYMNSMFRDATVFNQPIGNWDTSSVTNTSFMFRDATVFNQNINTKEITAENSPTGEAYTAWNVSNVTTMEYMFQNADNFNQSLGNWDVSSVTDMNTMFGGADVFNQDLNNWNVSNVTIMREMFYNAVAFNQNISYWTVSNGTYLGDMFRNSGIGSDNTYGFSVPTPTFNQFNQQRPFKPVDKNALQEAVNKWYELANNSSDPDAVNTANSVTEDDYNADPSNVKYYGNPNTWDVTAVTDMSKLFSDIPNIGSYTNHPEINGWDVSNVTNMSGMFRNTAAFNQDISGWDVSSVTDMRDMFHEAAAFNQDIGSWNVSQVTNMYHMFYRAASFNQDIGQWNVSQVTDMRYMFLSATAFNQNISYWNVSQYKPDGVTLTELKYMFYNSGIDENNTYGFSVPTPTYDQFNQQRPFKPVDKNALQTAVNKWYEIANDGSENAVTTANNVTKEQYDADPSTVKYYGNPNTWDVTAVKDMQGLFQGKTGLNHPDISNWDVSHVTNMREMFKHSQFNLPIGNWNTSSVTSMFGMFWAASDFNQDINTKEVTIDGSTYTAWDVSSVENMGNIFREATSFDGDISDWDVSAVINMNRMFGSANSFNQDISQWNTSKAQTMKSMFGSANSFNQPIGNWDVSNVTNMEVMFLNATAFNQDISTKEVTAENSPTGEAYTAWNVSSVEYMNYMFAGTEVFNGSIANWNTSELKSISRMFYNAKKFNQNVNHLNVSKIPSNGWHCEWLFEGATSFNNGEEPGQSTSPLTFVGYEISGLRGFGERAFRNAESFNQPLDFVCSKNDIWYYTFDGATLFNQNVNHLIQPSQDFRGHRYVNGLFNNATEFNNGGEDINIHIKEGDWGFMSAGWNNDMFYGCSKLNVPVTVNYDIGKNLSVSRMFFECTIFNKPITLILRNNFKFIDMNRMFYGATSFNQPIGDWDVSSVTNMDYMFELATSFNQDISNWDTSSVLNMRGMFMNAYNFNKDISKWNVSKVENMRESFSGSLTFQNNFGGATRVFDTDQTTYKLRESAESWGGFAVTKEELNLPLKFTNDGTITFNAYTSTDANIKFRLEKDLYVSSTEDPKQTTDFYETQEITIIPDQTSYSITIPSQGTQEFNNVMLYVVTQDVPVTINGLSINNDTPSNKMSFDQNINIWKVNKYKSDGTTPTELTYMFDNMPIKTGNIYGFTIPTPTYDEFNKEEDTTKPVITSNLVTNINKRDTYLGTVSANEPVIWSVNNEDIQVDQNGIVTLKQPADYQVKQSYSYIITATDQNKNTSTINQNVSVYKVFTPETKEELQNAINTWYELANGSDNGGYSSPLEYANKYSNPNTWNVTLMTDMSGLFKGKTGNNHPNIRNWKTQNVTTMESMFEGSTFNKDIGCWNVRNVKIFKGMFKNNSKFDNGGSNSIDTWTTYWKNKV